MRSRVVSFIADHVKIDRAAAEAVHFDYYARFGSTLQGMVQLHGVSPHAFLDWVSRHRSVGAGAERRSDRCAWAPPGRRISFTNAPRCHASSALKALGMADLFEAVASIEDSAFIGKPNLSAFSGFDAHGVDLKTAAMFEDRPGNLLVPHQLGMKTVFVVDPLFEDADRIEKPAHADLVVTDLTGFLRQLVPRPERALIKPTERQPRGRSSTSACDPIRISAVRSPSNGDPA